MPNIVEITDLSAPELDVYARLTQAQLRNRLEPEKGIFIAESPKVISRALDAGYQPISLLMERKQITGPAAEILTRCGDAPVYTADREPPPGTPFRGRTLQKCPAGGCSGGHCGFYQRGGHLPQCSGPQHGCRPHQPLLL